MSEREKMVYDSLYAMLDTDDLLCFADRLDRFLDIGTQSPVWSKWLQKMYSEFATWEFMSRGFSIKQSTCECFSTKRSSGIGGICEGKGALLVYVNRTLPQPCGPKRTVVKLREYALQLRRQFTAPVGERIMPDEIDSVVRYMEERYGVMSALFAVHMPVFALINNSHVEHNNESYCVQTHIGMRYCFFLYHMNGRRLHETRDIKKSPVAVFFHELGHVVYFAYAGLDASCVPVKLMGALKVLAPGIAELPYKEQLEVIADSFAMGMMYDSPFAELDHFLMDEGIKKCLNEVFVMVLGCIMENCR